MTKTFASTQAVNVPTQGTANPYPSVITVAGLSQGAILDVNVRLPAFQHGFPKDVDALLVGPRGQSVVLMSDVGGGGAVPAPIDVRFDDEAAAALAADAQIKAGAFRPSDVAGNDPNGIDVSPPPAPAGFHDAVPATFDGTDPNGDWRLFINDDDSGLGGVLGGGWSLEITARVRT